ncbi:MAG: sigma-70 family RNA polymerase sigma factor [Planctomycetales bacterium]|nr:sigma-70 family RNA polymerase sigma factor [Planctomycetales bacterium]
MAEPQRPPDPDAELMLRFQGGDEGAFTALVERHQQTVLSLAARFVGPGADAEDLAQEILIRVYRARNQWRPEAKFTTWLYRVAANLCLNWIRDRSRKPAVSLDAGIAGHDDPPPEPPDRRAEGPEAGAVASERAAIVRRAVEALPANQRMAVLLFRYEGLSYVEVADALGISLQAVKSLLNRAKENLKDALKGLVEPEGT